MQSRAIRRLAREMRSTHRITKSWLATAKRHHIVNAQGIPSKGLAYRIAIDGYEPREHETLLRLRLPCYCDECERIRKFEKRSKRLNHVPLFEMRDCDIIDALNNRVELKSTHSKAAMNEFIKACKRASQQRRRAS